MVKVITQETFDAVVRENMEEFDMTQTEALQEALAQFTSQGIDLGNILQRNPAAEGEAAAAAHPALETLAALRTATNSADADAALAHLDVLAVQLAAAGDQLPALRVQMAGTQGLTTLLAGMVLAQAHGASATVASALCAVATLLEGQPDIVSGTPADAVTNEEGAIVASAPVVQIMAVLRSLATDLSVQLAGLRAMRHACTLHETNRQAFIGEGALPHLLAIATLSTIANPPCNEATVEAMQCLRVLTSDDDIRVPYGKAADNIKYLVSEANALKVLLVDTLGPASDAACTVEIFKTVSQLAVRNEYCKEIVALGGLQRTLEVLEPEKKSSPALTHAACTVLRAIAGNDDNKAVVGKANGIELLVEALQINIRQAPVVEQGCAALAALCLRSPSNAEAFVLANGPNILVRCMHVHHSQAKLLRQVCQTIRNVVSRSRHLVNAILGEGTEAAIRRIMITHQDCQDTAKAALRDLGCKVELKELWTGAVRTGDGDNIIPEHVDAATVPN